MTNIIQFPTKRKLEGEERRKFIEDTCDNVYFSLSVRGVTTIPLTTFINEVEQALLNQRMDNQRLDEVTGDDLGYAFVYSRRNYFLNPPADTSMEK